MPTFASRRNSRSKRRKLNVQRSLQRILAQELIADNNGNRVTNESLSDELMIESCDCEENSDASMAEPSDTRENGNISDGEISFVPPADESMSSDEEDDPNNLSFDENNLFGFDLMLSKEEGMNDNQESVETAPAGLAANDMGETPQAMIYQDEDKTPPTAEDDVEFSDLEVAGLGLLCLCNNSGTSRQFFNDLLTLLRRFSKKGIDITKAKGHASFLAIMQSKVKCPKPASKKVDGCDVIYFPFFDSLQDLLRSSAFYDIDNLCANKAEQDCFHSFQPMTVADSSEIMSNEWAIQTQDSLVVEEDFDPEQDFFLALQMYGDKTGTNVNQCYRLEPWMFTLAVLQLMAREDPNNWQHLGFILSQDFAPSNSKVTLSSEEKLQQYHDYMSVLLNEVKEVSKAKPMMWVNLGGVWKKKRLHIFLSIVSGDQKSQDFICGRRAINNGSASHVHRRCMALAVNSTAVGPGGALHGGCQKPPIEVLNRLNDLTLMDVGDDANLGPMAVVNKILPADTAKQWKEKKPVVQLIHHVNRLATNILAKVFLMHPHRNAFDGIDFGTNKHGILVATAEDHLHSCEVGIMLNLVEVAYGGLTESK